MKVDINARILSAKSHYIYKARNLDGPLLILKWQTEIVKSCFFRIYNRL